MPSDRINRVRSTTTLVVSVCALGCTNLSRVVEPQRVSISSEAEELAKHCRFSEAIAVLEGHPDAMQSDLDSEVLLAALYSDVGNGPKALDLLRQASFAQNEPYCWLIRAGTEGQVQSYAAARKSLAMAYSVGASTALIEGLYGEIELSRGDLRNAETHLTSALEREPTLTGSLYNLGILRVKQKRMVDAAARVRQSWDLGERNSEQIRTDPDLEELRQRHLLDDLSASPRSNAK